MQLFILMPLVALCCWIYAEKRAGFAARFVTGIVCIALNAGAWQAITNIGHNYESDFHRSSMRLASKLIYEGNTMRVHQAIQAYDRIASTGTTYAASMEMWYVLNHGPRQ